LVTAIFFEEVIPFLKNFVLEETVIFLMVILLFVFQTIRNSNHSAILNIFVTLGGVIYVSWLLSFLLKIVFLASVDGRVCLFYLILVAKSSDVGACCIGTLWGKIRLVPKISPKKTVEGALGGVFLAALISYIGGVYLLPLQSSLFQLLFLGVVISIIAQIGDLAESILKRDSGVKDSGRYIPGMGGVLDLLDSVLFTAPFMYFYLMAVLQFK
jgi:phosphatidate cytidylyltransferase